MVASIFSRDQPTPTQSELYGDDVTSKKKKEKRSAFLCNLKLTLIVLRFSGLFPMKADKKLHPKNLPSFLVIAFVGGMSLYKIVVEMLPTFLSMFTNWEAEVGVDFGICLYFCINFASLVFVASLGYGRKLERFSELLLHATGQEGIEVHFKSLIKKQNILLIIIVNACFFNFGIYAAFFLFPGLTNIMPVTINKLKHIFGESNVAHLFTLIWAPIAYMTLYMSAFLYWTCCKCLRLEFEQISKDITECDLKKVDRLPEIALRHSRLLDALYYLHKIYALYVMCMFAFGSLIDTLFAYVILQRQTDFGFRLLAGYWLFLTACVNFLLCLTAEALHTSVKNAKEKVCSKIAEEADPGIPAFDCANLICEQAVSGSHITAFGFFTVSKELLLSIYSFIATYVIILLQTPPSSAALSKKSLNTTN